MSVELADYIRVWGFSTDFPTTLATDPPMSLRGITFLRGKIQKRAMGEHRVVLERGGVVAYSPVVAMD